MEFRELRADEIDVRIQSIKKGANNSVYAIFLLYKDARCDMNILDETVGPSRWKRSHDVINGNLFCNVSIYDEDIHEWITKQDVGTESNTEKEKGQASDSFKRACVNWGIGRELYTAPFIIIYLNEDEYHESKGRYTSSVKLAVKEIEYTDRKISKLILVDKSDNVRYTYPNTQSNYSKKELAKKETARSNGHNPLPRLDTREEKQAFIGQTCRTNKAMSETIKQLYSGKKLSEFTDAELEGIVEVINTELGNA